MDQIRKPQAKPGAPVVAPVSKPQKSGGAKKYIVAIIVVALLLVAGAAVYKFVYKQKDTLTGVNPEQYQALFLTNGQVYFGKLEKADSKTVKVSDIFYLQVQQPVQPKAEGAADAAQGETQLVKLGQELHGPEDEMYIDRGQVLFWENLKQEGKVAQAIAGYKKQ